MRCPTPLILHQRGVDGTRAAKNVQTATRSSLLSLADTSTISPLSAHVRLTAVMETHTGHITDIGASAALDGHGVSHQAVLPEFASRLPSAPAGDSRHATDPTEYPPMPSAGCKRTRSAASSSSAPGGEDCVMDDDHCQQQEWEWVPAKQHRDGGARSRVQYASIAAVTSKSTDESMLWPSAAGVAASAQRSQQLEVPFCRDGAGGDSLSTVEDIHCDNVAELDGLTRADALGSANRMIHHGMFAAASAGAGPLRGLAAASSLRATGSGTAASVHPTVARTTAALQPSSHQGALGAPTVAPLYGVLQPYCIHDTAPAAHAPPAGIRSVAPHGARLSGHARAVALFVNTHYRISPSMYACTDASETGPRVQMLFVDRMWVEVTSRLELDPAVGVSVVRLECVLWCQSGGTWTAARERYPLFVEAAPSAKIPLAVPALGGIIAGSVVFKGKHVEKSPAVGERRRPVYALQLMATLSDGTEVAAPQSEPFIRQCRPSTRSRVYATRDAGTVMTESAIYAALPNLRKRSRGVTVVYEDDPSAAQPLSLRRMDSAENTALDGLLSIAAVTHASAAKHTSAASAAGRGDEQLLPSMNPSHLVILNGGARRGGVEPEANDDIMLDGVAAGVDTAAV